MFISKETTESLLSKKDFFRLARIFLKIFGNWPMESHSLPIRFYINFISLFIAAILGVAIGFVHLSDNLNEALANFTASIFELVSWFKVLFVYINRKKLSRLLNILYRYYISQGKYFFSRFFQFFFFHFDNLPLFRCSKY